MELECYYCAADLESEFRRNVDCGLALLATLKQPDVTECEALTRGLICTACWDKMSCAYCGQVGGELIPEIERCSLCVPAKPHREYELEDDIEMARRRPRYMPERMVA
jgi:hypothetical protein